MVSALVFPPLFFQPGFPCAAPGLRTSASGCEGARVSWVPWARASRSQRVKTSSQGHGKTPEVHCQDCDGAGRERGRGIQDPEQNPHHGWAH